MAQRGRVDGGRLQAWKVALAHLKANRGIVAQCLAAVVGSVILINSPFVSGSPYVRGMITGVVLVAFLWMMSWFAWVSSGLAFRIQGSFAQDEVTSRLRAHKTVYDVIPSLKFESRDIDQIVITPAGVAVVETKWHAPRSTALPIEGDAHQAARNARTIRHSLPGLQTAGLPRHLVTAALVLCGPGSRGVSTGAVETSLGAVEIVNQADLEKWITAQKHGPLGSDFAMELGQELHALAEKRDRANVKSGPLLRWLCRVR